MKQIKLLLIVCLSLNLLSIAAFAEGNGPDKENKHPGSGDVWHGNKAAQQLHNEVYLNEHGQYVSTGTRKKRADDALKALKRPKDPNAAKKADFLARKAKANAVKPPKH